MSIVNVSARLLKIDFALSKFRRQRDEIESDTDQAAPNERSSKEKLSLDPVEHNAILLSEILDDANDFFDNGTIEFLVNEAKPRDTRAV